MANLVRERTDQRKSALIAGTSLIIMTLAASFSYGFAHGSLVVHGNVSATFNNILSSTILFKAEIFGWLIILICDIVVAWAFFIFMKPLSKNLSLLAAWLRLTYATILGLAILNLVVVMLLTNGSNYLSAFDTDQLQAQVMLFLEAFEVIWSIGLIIFGVHLFVVGYVASKSESIPKIISILLLVASIGYILTHLCKTFLPQYDAFMLLDFVFILPMIVGELGFGLWLLFRGGKVSTMK
ncbi:DUF4386 domain-containing protein [Bacillus sp. DJP31]|uniref:DUF4386 domain-containing protein n=1 Tax=Bacillus sp. DJP31 TaxID=3409789 RepID=UPI003BB7E8A9